MYIYFKKNAKNLLWSEDKLNSRFCSKINSLIIIVTLIRKQKHTEPDKEPVETSKAECR